MCTSISKGTDIVGKLNQVSDDITNTNELHIIVKYATKEQEFTLLQLSGSVIYCHV